MSTPPTTDEVLQVLMSAMREAGGPSSTQYMPRTWVITPDEDIPLRSVGVVCAWYGSARITVDREVGENGGLRFRVRWSADRVDSRTFRASGGFDIDYWSTLPRVVHRMIAPVARVIWDLTPPGGLRRYNVGRKPGPRIKNKEALIQAVKDGGSYDISLDENNNITLGKETPS